MASLSESQAFLDQFDKCLPLCEKGDAVILINALNTLNNITKASIAQAQELDPASGRDFVCSFLIELELALELYISPTKKLGTIDGGLPELYRLEDSAVAQLVDAPSPLTKTKVKKFLDALGVPPSAEFEHRTIKDTVKDFLKNQVKPAPAAQAKRTPSFKQHRNRNISWADQCSSGASSDCSDCGSLPALEDSDTEDLPGLESDSEETEPAVVVADPECSEDEADDEDEDEDEDEVEDEDESQSDLLKNAAAIFILSAPVRGLEQHDMRDDVSTGSGSSRRSNTSSEAHCSQAARDQGRRANGRQDPFYKTRICKNWEQTGACQFGVRCNFAHGEEELRNAESAIFTLSAKAPATRRASDETLDNANRRPAPSTNTRANYKTRLCKNFEQSGHCSFGDKCMFAHGHQELRKGTASEGRPQTRRQWEEQA
mmetsp:Transcript_12009/g.18818  ORF Transcript_12009/g.18818 Transcript_12009/m.18818 type:complete len:430 (+) Transcript_12009:76-1365(+)|eukprot:CAMPEP_0184311518 /NCGR_PEP_ID=MMETSP1049-20130417/41973_1 /TAXON_ID=77928 /ORGANISM="Proteomonas sulcata, Strain CCMP704" /LENGTH=429 /DNA_ID=CAMNT_0026626951 /DNA_START=105 /DNA_END=1394 /DNA_ORIENTATION=+